MLPSKARRIPRESANLHELLRSADHLLHEAWLARVAGKAATQRLKSSLTTLQQSRAEFKADCRRMIGLRMESEALRGVSRSAYVLPYKRWL